jgi:hypothetical protein
VDLPAEPNPRYDGGAFFSRAAVADFGYRDPGAGGESAGSDQAGTR